jgi:hypothetical protein
MQTILNFRGQQLTALPASIGQLQRLRKLHLEGNRLMTGSLGIQVVKCVRLYSANRLTTTFRR